MPLPPVPVYLSCVQLGFNAMYGQCMHMHVFRPELTTKLPCSQDSRVADIVGLGGDKVPDITS